MEPNILTIKELREENAQLKSELKRLQEIEKEHRNLNGSLRKRINDAIDFIDNTKVVSYESDEVYYFKEIPESYDLWNILYEEDESPYCEESEISFRNCLNKMTDYKTRINEAVDILKLCNSQCAKETINILTGENND